MPQAHIYAIRSALCLAALLIMFSPSYAQIENNAVPDATNASEVPRNSVEEYFTENHPSDEGISSLAPLGMTTVRQMRDPIATGSVTPVGGAASQESFTVSNFPWNEGQNTLVPAWRN